MGVSGLDSRVTQADFAALVGVSQPRVAQMIDEGVLPREGTAGQWLTLYCERLREQASGRGSELTAERAKLARAQREGQEIKNRVAQGEYAPVGLLGDVLSSASAAVVSRFDGLMPHLAKVCPELTEAQRRAIESVMARARNEWVRVTSSLAVQMVDELAEDPEDPDADAEGGEDDVAGDPAP